MIWIILTISLYLWGMVPTWAYIRDDGGFKNEPKWFNILFVGLWFLAALIWLIYLMIDCFRTKKLKGIFKCLIPILFISLLACNDPGSPVPDRYDPEEAAYYDSMANATAHTTGTGIAEDGGAVGGCKGIYFQPVRFDTISMAGVIRPRNLRGLIPNKGGAIFDVDYALSSNDTIPLPFSLNQTAGTDLQFRGIRNNDPQYYDTTPVKNHNAIFVLDTSRMKMTNYYLVMISSPKKGKVAYLKPDSAWVILDSAETLNMLLWCAEQQAKMIK